MTSKSKQHTLHLGADCIFRTSGGGEREPTTNTVLVAAGVSPRVYERPDDLHQFFEDCGLHSAVLDQLLAYYLPSEASPTDK